MYKRQNKKLPELEDAINTSIPFLRWQINNTISNKGPQTIEERVLVASECLQIVKNHHEEMFHDDYVKYIANEFDLPYAGLREKFDKLNEKIDHNIRMSCFPLRANRKNYRQYYGRIISKATCGC